MPMFSQPSVSRTAGITAAASILLGIGVVFSIYSNSGSPVLQCYSGTGCVISSRLTVQGTVIGTGTTINQVSQDARYVNTKGDTMTGGLLINSGNTTATVDPGTLLEIIGIGSGRILSAMDSLNSSGTLAVRGVSTFQNNANVRGTLSGALLTIMNGTSYVMGNFGVGASPNGKFDVNGTIRTTNQVSPASGNGGEFSFDGTNVILRAYNRTGGSYLPLAVKLDDVVYYQYCFW